MPNSDAAWWAGTLSLIFVALSIASIIIKNNLSKKDSIGRSEKDTIANSVSMEPRKKHS